MDDEVRGPYSTEQLEGKITEDTLVCRAGDEEWQNAADVPTFSAMFEALDTPTDPSPDGTSSIPSNSATKSDQKIEIDEIEPTLNELHKITRHATTEDIKREYNEFWSEYDSREQRILRNEMIDRGIWDELSEPDLK